MIAELEQLWQGNLPLQDPHFITLVDFPPQLQHYTHDSKLPLALFLMGPTASGKTDLAIRLRQKYPVEIISVDSALIYRGWT